MAIQVIRTIQDLRTSLAGKKSIAFVPTMGNLHAGHLALVDLARTKGQLVVASIFVNRLQFLPHEDFDQYPRTLERDSQLLETAGCDILFAPDEQELYPSPQSYKLIPAENIANILEGEYRPGFFTGVCTVVNKLFNCVQPHYAVFGKKDYQQLMVIRQMMQQFALPIELLAGETQRAPNGLALSSRNAYLSPTEQAEASRLYAVLNAIRQAIQNGAEDLVQLTDTAIADLVKHNWAPDYISVRRRADLQVPTPVDLATPSALVVLGAARLGKTRLIDNLEI